MDTHSPAFRSLVVENAIDLMSDLRYQTGITTALATFTKDRKRGIVLASLPGLTDHGYLPRVGSRFDLHATAPGKALLAGLRKQERENIIHEIELKKFTEKTLTDPTELARHLEDCSRNRVVYDQGEYLASINCAACCITLNDGDPIAALWVTSLTINLPDEQLPEIGQKVLAAATQMTERLRGAIDSSSLRYDYALKQAKAFIEEHFHDEAAIRSYHRQIGMSDSWFRRIFREKYGIAPISYRLELMHQRACRLLSNTQLSVKEIAFQMRYESQNYFSRAFKKRAGVSPAHYREQQKNPSIDNDNS